MSFIAFEQVGYSYYDVAILFKKLSFALKPIVQLKTVITEYKPFGLLKWIGVFFLFLFPVYSWVLYECFERGRVYNNWFLNIFLAETIVICAPVVVVNLLSSTLIVLNTRKNILYKQFRFIGISVSFGKKRFPEAEYISMIAQSYTAYDNADEYAGQKININIWNNGRHITLLQYNVYEDALRVATEIAETLDVPLYDKVK